MSTSDRSNELSETSPSTASYSRVVAKGMAWNTLALIIGRVTGFVAQLILGWLLSENDYGTYAIAIGLSVIVLTLRSTGAQKLLIQRGREYDDLARPLAIISFVVNVLAMFVLWAVAPLAAEFFQAPAVVPLIWVIGASMPLAVPADILRARLSIDLRFRDLALLNAGMLVLTQALSVVLALLQFGPMSFALPLAIVAATESIILWRMVGWWPVGRSLQWGLVKELFASTKWIILCGFSSALIVQGTQLVVAGMETLSVTGLFSFGFQLTSAVALFFNTGMQRVLMPALTRLSDDLRRQGQAYLKSVRVLVACASPICLWGVLVAGPMMHVLWGGKWDRSIVVVQLLTAILPIYVLTAINAAVLEARGLWRANTLFHFASGLGTITAAWVGSSWGGLFEIALAAAAFRIVFALLHGWLVSRIMGLPRTAYLRAALPPFVVCVLISVAIGWLAIRSMGDWSPLLQAACTSALYLLLVAVAYLLGFQARVREAAHAFGWQHGSGLRDPSGDRAMDATGERPTEVR